MVHDFHGNRGGGGDRVNAVLVRQMPKLAFINDSRSVHRIGIEKEDVQKLNLWGMMLILYGEVLLENAHTAAKAVRQE